MRNRFLLAAVLLVTGAFASSARADGVVFVEDGGLQGIATSTGFRYVTVQERGHTVLERIAPSGRIAAVRVFSGLFTIPAVARDHTTSGLSADENTLVLVDPRYGGPLRVRTPFLILSLPGLFVRSAPTLAGDFSFDAISPNGSLLYFIQHTSARDTTRYAVRVFDRSSGKLLPGAVVDKSEPEEIMRGNPLSRVTSTDGRWAYTLYDGGGKTPFVHALDTVERTARCVDLDALSGRDDLLSLTMRRDPSGLLSIRLAQKPLLYVDTRSFQVSPPTALSSPQGGSRPWAPIGVAVVVVLTGAAVSLALVRRRRPATS